MQKNMTSTISAEISEITEIFPCLNTLIGKISRHLRLFNSKIGARYKNKGKIIVEALNR